MGDTTPAGHLATLAAQIRGSVLLPGDSGYDDARAIWNGMIDRYPAAIVRCRGAADVIAALRCARAANLPLSIRAGGHNVAGKAIRDDGLVIDLSLMNDVRVDPLARRARAGGGALWQDFDHEAQAFGLTTTGGVVSTTGVAGLTLGGGIGYLTRSYGLACDNLLAADVVTADGRLVHASETENADLLWGLRGGGGSFGVVTSLEFRLHPVGPMVAAATVFHAMDSAPEVLRRYREYATSAPDSVACYAMVVNAPPDFPPEHQGKPVLAVVACCSASVAEGLEMLAPLATWGSPLLSVVDEMPYVALQQAFNAGNPHGGRYYWKTQHLTDLNDELLDTVVRFASDLHGPLSIIGIEPLGGAQGRVASDATAFPYRDVPFSLGIWSGWTDAADDDANITWTRRFFEAVRPHGAGVYVNYLGADEGDRLEEAYGANYARLVELKRRWDPDNVF
ncbi:MAG: FAD-binding oxidoreductase [Pseudomonadales bacterium]